MKKVLKDLPFVIAYLDVIIIYGKTEEHLDHLQQISTSFRLQNYETEQVSLLCQGNLIYFCHVLSTTGIKSLPSKVAAFKVMNPPKNAYHVRAFLDLLATTPSSS